MRYIIDLIKRLAKCSQKPYRETYYNFKYIYVRVVNIYVNI